jgi:N-acetylglutamate synthase-like GNAT family acetyltransferase
MLKENRTLITLIEQITADNICANHFYMRHLRSIFILMKKENISTATVADIDELNMLVNSAYRGDSSRKGWTTEADLLDGIRTDSEGLLETISRSDSQILKYLNEEGKIIGCVHLEMKGNKLYLGMLTVSPTLQNGGIGKQLLAAAEQVALEKQCDSIYMTVLTERTELIDWYKRHGYSLTGETQPFPMNNPRFGLPKKHLEFVVMQKQL